MMKTTNYFATLIFLSFLEGRDKISNQLQKIIDERTEPWGINVISVEVKDVLIPQALETMQLGGLTGLTAMSMGFSQGRQKEDKSV